MGTEYRQSRAHRFFVSFFEKAEVVLYGAVGLLLIIIALITIAIVAQNILNYFSNFTAITGLQELFLTLIILELLMTVVGYMRTRSINLGLLLGAGLTAMIRKIITVGYEPIAVPDFALILAATAILVAAIAFIGNKTIHP